jgi:ABC-type phosphate transport system permease subunit
MCISYCPVGVFAGIYLSEYAKSNNKLPFQLLFADVLTGLPSIIVGRSHVIIVISMVLLL